VLGQLYPASVRRDSYTAAVYVGSLSTAAVIGVYGLVQPWLATSPPDWWKVSLLDLVVVATCLAVAASARVGLLRPVARLDAALMVLLSTVAVGILVEAVLAPERETYLIGNYLVCMVAAGAVMRSWGALLAFLIGSLTVWLLLHGINDPDAVRWLPTLLLAAGVACAVRGYVATLYGTTRGRELAAQATARVDSLTGLPNRLGLNDQVRALSGIARRGEQRLWVAFLDVNGFKLVNDTFGHQVGDELLCAVAASLESVARDADAVARWGGDEFVIVGLGDPPGADLLEARVIESLAEENPLRVHGWPALVTVGVAATGHAPDNDEVEAALRDADLSMYARRGRR